MSEESKEIHNSGLLYFMPAWIFESKELSNTSKLVYSLLSGLAFGKESKECFPSDEYIGNRLGISRQQANECVGNLERFGALSKRTVPNEKNPFRKIRFIKIYLENQKSFTKSGKADSRDDEKADSPLSGKADSSNKVYSNKGKKKNVPTPSEIETPPPSSEDFHEDIKKLAEYFYTKLKGLYPEISKPVMNKWMSILEKMHRLDGKTIGQIRKAIDFALADDFWKSNILSPDSLRKNYDKLYVQWMNKKESKADRSIENERWAKEFEKKMGNICKFETYASYAEFRTMGNGMPVAIKYDENGFKEQVLNQTRKMGLIQFWEEA